MANYSKFYMIQNMNLCKRMRGTKSFQESCSPWLIIESVNFISYQYAIYFTLLCHAYLYFKHSKYVLLFVKQISSSPVLLRSSLSQFPPWTSYFLCAFFLILLYISFILQFPIPTVSAIFSLPIPYPT
jgi:hypothetical protein